MKINFIAGSLLLLLAACDQSTQDAYTVKGNIQNNPATTIYLEEATPAQAQPLIVDSATIEKDGDFKLKTLSKGEALYSLRLNNNRYPFASFINDTEEITVQADFSKPQDPYSVKGSPASQQLKDYLSNLGTRLDALHQITFPADTSSYTRPQRDSIRASVQGKVTEGRNGLKSYVTSFIAGSNNATLSLYALSSFQSLASNPAFGLEPLAEEDIKTIIDNAVKKFPGNASLVSIQQSLQGAGPKEALTTAPDFTLPDVNGKAVSLSSFKGQYVLVDFWASWCPPCRAENPNLVAAHNQYKGKNFTILGVSLDKDKQEWLKGIKEDNLAWTHVSDLKFWESMVVPLYRIEAIPYNVLLDPQGNVIGENLTGQALQQKLAQVLN